MAEIQANKKNEWQLKTLLLSVVQLRPVREGLYFVGALVVALTGFALVLLLPSSHTSIAGSCAT